MVLNNNFLYSGRLISPQYSSTGSGRLKNVKKTVGVGLALTLTLTTFIPRHSVYKLQ